MNYRAGPQLNQWLWLLIYTEGVRKLKSKCAVNTSPTPVHNLSLRTNVFEECQLPGTTVLTQSPSSTKTGDGISSWAARGTGCCCKPYWVSGPHLYGQVSISVWISPLVRSVLCGHLNRGICWRGSLLGSSWREILPHGYQDVITYFYTLQLPAQCLIANNAWIHGLTSLD